MKMSNKYIFIEMKIIVKKSKKFNRLYIRFNNKLRPHKMVTRTFRGKHIDSDHFIVTANMSLSAKWRKESQSSTHL